MALTVRPTYDCTPPSTPLFPSPCIPDTLFLSVPPSFSVTEPRSSHVVTSPRLALPRIPSGQFPQELSNCPKVPSENNERRKGVEAENEDACACSIGFFKLGGIAESIEKRRELDKSRWMLIFYVICQCSPSSSCRVCK